MSPHPDDDLLIAAGVIHRAVANGDSVKVVYMTNGDINGSAEGYLRQAEAVTAQLLLGMVESSLIFLGYPDGYLSTVYNSYPAQSDIYTSPWGQSHTYGNRGLGSKDYHSFRFGAAANYNRYNVLLDLQDIISNFKPDHIYTLSKFDNHPDHSITYTLVHDSIAAIVAASPGYTPTLHKTIVWWGPGGWPSSIDASSYHSQIPNLFAQTGLVWNDRESLDVPLDMQSTEYPSNPKYLAIASHVSQGGTSGVQGGIAGFLGSFIHKDEVFWSENFTSNRTPIANAGTGDIIDQGEAVQINGTSSYDPDGSPITFQWLQVAGSPVQLTNPTTAQPSFTAPTSLTDDDTLAFRLIVSDGLLSSAPDAVEYEIPIFQNIAGLATVTASSEKSQTGQSAVKAIDGIVDGSPGDSTREWSTNGEGAGAWLNLSWPAAFTIERVILFDRPNSSDQIQAGTIVFSDGSSMSTGVLDNSGLAKKLTFSPKTITSLRLNIQQVSSATANIGLAEIKVLRRMPSESISGPNTPTGTANGTTGQSYNFTAGGATSSLGHTVQYQFDWGDGTLSAWGSGTQSKAWSIAATYAVRARARCSTDTSILSNWSPALTVTITQAETISAPATPSGPINGTTGQSYSYSTGGSTSNLGHTVQYQFDWGDGALSAWGSGTQSRIWSAASTYAVKARARCSTDTSTVSDWSSALTVTVTQTETVSAPTTPSGPASGTTAQSYSYSTGGATSTLGHTVQYQFDWSGSGSDLSAWGSATQSRTWTTAGTYGVRARARCGTDTGIVSDWSSALTITITVAETVSAPVTPNGNSSGTTGQSYSYTTGGAISNWGSALQYQFDWSGSGTDLSAWGSATQAKTWSTAGSYSVKARARSINDTSVVSGWSSAFSVTITANEIVSTPVTPTGSTTGDTQQSLSYSTGGSASNFGHGVEYQFDWGDGSFSAWGGATQSKTWSTAATYAVKARARCTADTGIVSGWSAALSVSVSAADTLQPTPTPGSQEGGGGGGGGGGCFIDASRIGEPLWK